LAVVPMVFLSLNPVLTARPDGSFTGNIAELVADGPWRRFRTMIEVRLRVSRDQQGIFPHNALTTRAERLKVFAVQGFGRYGPLGPSKSDTTVRFDSAQDWGLVLWWPVVLLGVVQTVRLGWQQLAERRPPTAFALLIWAAVAWAVVALYLPMAWDRYLLPIQ